MPVQSIPVVTLRSEVFLDLKFNDAKIMGGGGSCCPRDIANKINHITGNRDNIYIHGSNSKSLATFTNDLRRGELLPAAQQRELGLSVCCGDKLKSSFRFENGEREHERVFAFRCDTQSPHLSEEAVGEVSLYCGYGTENNEAFPVIYIFSDTDKSMVQAQHIEYMTPKGESIR
ncbi:hypothetical protein CF635_003549 [Enterobacter hormaechei]|nr:hypothetical protein [Enterobacter hormaechei]